MAGGRPSYAASEPGLACPLWSFSLRFYGQPGVSRMLLEAQDLGGADVNMLLFCLWHAYERRAVSGGELLAMDELVAEWRRDVVVPLRSVRRRMKEMAGADSPYYAQTKALELKCEHAQQMRMYEGSRDIAPGAAADASVEDLAIRNLHTCAEALSVDLSEPIVKALAAELHSAADDGQP